MDDTSMTIRQAQQRVDEWIKTYGVRYFNELTNMAVLTEEVGELARIMARRYGEQSFKPGENQDPLGESHHTLGAVSRLESGEVDAAEEEFLDLLCVVFCLLGGQQVGHFGVDVCIVYVGVIEGEGFVILADFFGTVMSVFHIKVVLVCHC